MGHRRDDDEGSLWSWPLAAVLLIATVAMLGFVYLLVYDWFTAVVRSLVDSAMDDPGLLTIVIGLAIIVGSGALILLAVLPNPQLQPLHRIAVVALGITGLAAGVGWLGAVALGSFDAAMRRLGPLTFGAFGISMMLVGAWAALSRGGTVMLRVSGVITVLGGAFVLWVLFTGRVVVE
jgi:hypothetical protein